MSLPAGTEVRVTTPSISFTGVVVGLSTTDITQSHIIKCIDEKLPNEIYPYNTCSIPLALLEPMESVRGHSVLELDEEHQRYVDKLIRENRVESPDEYYLAKDSKDK